MGSRVLGADASSPALRARSAYLLADFLGIAVLYWASTFIDPSPLHPALKAAAWALYWFVQARTGWRQSCPGRAVAVGVE